MKITRRTFLASVAGAGVAGLAGFGYMRKIEPSWFDVTRKTVPLSGLQRPLRLLHLSDFHASPAVSLELIDTALILGLQQKPDLIVLTGDFITDEYGHFADYAALLSRLCKAAPCFACLGNHDGGRWTAIAGGYPDTDAVRDFLKKSGATLLFNESRRIEISGAELEVAGLGDLWSDDLRPEQVLKQKDHDRLPPPLILLSHNPDSKAALWDYHWDLMCCGHTHGGQLVIPFIGARPFIPVEDTSFPEGLRFWGERAIHITRGVGNLHGMRFNCRPEISVLELVPLERAQA